MNDFNNMTRKELDQYIRAYAFQQRFLDKYGKCYSRCSKEEVIALLKDTVDSNGHQDNYADNNGDDRITIVKLFLRYLKSWLIHQ